MRIIFGLFIIISLLTEITAFAGVEIGGTRLVFNAESKEANISVSNNDKNKPYLIQSWVDMPDGQNGKAPFIITPPIFRLDGEQRNILRVLRTGGKLPEDKESIFWLNIKSIPTMAENLKGKNVLQFSVKNRMKLFYRPTGLQGTPEKAAANIAWKKEGGDLIAENKTGFFVNLSAVIVNGNKLPIDYTNSLIPPFGSAKFAFNKPIIAGSAISWKALNDYGAVSQVYSVTIQ